MSMWWKNRHDNFNHYPRVLDKLEVGAMHTFLAAQLALLWAAAVSFDAYCCEICFIGH